MWHGTGLEVGTITSSLYMLQTLSYQSLLFLVSEVIRAEMHNAARSVSSSMETAPCTRGHLSIAASSAGQVSTITVDVDACNNCNYCTYLQSQYCCVHSIFYLQVLVVSTKRKVSP